VIGIEQKEAYQCIVLKISWNRLIWDCSYRWINGRKKTAIGWLVHRVNH